MTCGIDDLLDNAKFTDDKHILDKFQSWGLDLLSNNQETRKEGPGEMVERAIVYKALRRTGYLKLRDDCFFAWLILILLNEEVVVWRKCRP